MGTGVRKDPYLGCNFLVEIDGLVVAGFNEVSGLDGQLEIHDYREGGENAFVHKFAGPVQYSSRLVLKRGITDDLAIWQWYQRAAEGKIERKTGSIILLDSAGNEVWRWNFTKAYPAKWSGPTMRAGTAEVAVETLELVHHGLSAVGSA